MNELIHTTKAFKEANVKKTIYIYIYMINYVSPFSQQTEVFTCKGIWNPSVRVLWVRLDMRNVRYAAREKLTLKDEKRT